MRRGFLREFDRMQSVGSAVSVDDRAKGGGVSTPTDFAGDEI